MSKAPKQGYVYCATCELYWPPGTGECAWCEGRTGAAPASPYEGKTVAELQASASERGIEIPSRASRAAIVALLSANDAGTSASVTTGSSGDPDQEGSD